MKPVSFKSVNLTLHGVLSLPPKYSTGVLFLHGGGQSNTSRYLYLQHEFANHSLASLAFDFRGCGQSQGRFEEGSLSNRLLDAQAALDFFILRSNLPTSSIYLWGSSMGGHLACRLTEQYPDLKGLILQSAAAYSAAAEPLLLNAQFTQAISVPNSWLYSPAFTALEAFTGNTLVIYGEHDIVVPPNIQTRYASIALAHGGQSVTLPSATHTQLRPQTPTEISALEQLTQIATEFILHNH